MTGHFGDQRERRLNGKRIERSEVGGPGEFEMMGDDQLERALAAALTIPM